MEDYQLPEISEELKARLFECIDRIRETILKAVSEIIQKLADFFRRFVAEIISKLPKARISRIIARAKAAEIEWKARGPRRNIALMRAILMKEENA